MKQRKNLNIICKERAGIRRGREKRKRRKGERGKRERERVSSSTPLQTKQRPRCVPENQLESIRVLGELD
jgi:hypothetical protein